MKDLKNTTYGIICFRQNTAEGNRRELLMVKRNCTYGFVDFLFGKYRPQNKKNIKKMFSSMTSIEKHAIGTLNFNIMWGLSMFDMSRLDFFKNKFKRTWCMEKEKTNELYHHLNTTPCIAGLWEFPKGRKTKKSESDMDCAVREFIEETMVERKNFQVKGYEKLKFLLTDQDEYYNMHFYFAQYMTSKKLPIISFNKDSKSEIIESKWMTYNEIKLYTPNMAVLFKKAIKIIKNSNKLSKRKYK